METTAKTRAKPSLDNVGDRTKVRRNRAVKHTAPNRQKVQRVAAKPYHLHRGMGMVAHRDPLHRRTGMVAHQVHLQVHLQAPL